MVARHAFRRSVLGVTLAAGLLTGGPALAAPPADARFTYQGRLSQDGVLGNGIYDFLFSVYDVSGGGLALATWAANDVQVTNGLFQTEVNFPSTVYSPAQKRWMQVEVRPGASVGAYSILGARQELLAVPFAAQTIIPVSLTTAYSAGRSIFTNDGPISISAPSDISFPPGSADAIHITKGQLRIGSLSAGGRGALLVSNGTTTNVATSFLGTVSTGGSIGDSLACWRQSGNTGPSIFTPNLEFFIGPSPSPAGGRLVLPSTNSGDSNIEIDGNNGSPFFEMLGSSESVRFDPEAPAPDNRTQLPKSSVFSHEIGDEPGVASNGDGINLVSFPSSGIGVLTSRTITCPAAGYVLAIASAQVNITHTSGASDSFDLGVSLSSSALPSNQDVACIIPLTIPTASLALPMTVHGLFPVAAGPVTVYFLANVRTGTETANDTQLSLVYFPTSYGTVNPTSLLGLSPDAGSRLRTTLGVDEIAREQQQSINANLARMRVEFDEMKHQLEELRRAQQDRPAPTTAQSSR